MGGGGETHNTVYEEARKGVSKRKYGEISKDGFQTEEQYRRALALKDVKNGGSTDLLWNPDGDHSLLEKAGLTYDGKFKRYKLKDSGVDLEAAIADWENYQAERKDLAIRKYEDERRKSAPKNLSGSSGKTLEIQTDTTSAVGNAEKPKASKKKKKGIVTQASLASTNQSLGIY